MEKKRMIGETSYAPIVLFVYNRPTHTKQLIDSLILNSLALKSELFIFSDAAKRECDEIKVNEVRNIIHSEYVQNAFSKVTVHENAINKGLANSIIEGISQVINIYGKVIVLEDDLIVANNFLEYMNQGLKECYSRKDIWAIGGYAFPIKYPDNISSGLYLNMRVCCWGWASWSDRWNTVDWNVSDYKKFKKSPIKRWKWSRWGNDLPKMLENQMRGKINSWAIRWGYQAFLDNKYTVYPITSFVKQNGMDGSGTHCGESNEYKVEFDSENKVLNFESADVNNSIRQKINRKYDYNIMRKIVSILISIMQLNWKKR